MIAMGKPKKLRILFKQAKMGKPHRMYALAMRYYAGHGVEADMEKALYWMHLAADTGYPPAEDFLKDYYFDDDAAVQAHS